MKAGVREGLWQVVRPAMTCGLETEVVLEMNRSEKLLGSNRSKVNLKRQRWQGLDMCWGQKLLEMKLSRRDGRVKEEDCLWRVEMAKKKKETENEWFLMMHRRASRTESMMVKNVKNVNVITDVTMNVLSSGHKSVQRVTNVSYSHFKLMHIHKQ